VLLAVATPVLTFEQGGSVLVTGGSHSSVEQLSAAGAE